MPLTSKGEEILANMRKQYGSDKKAKQVFYASKNAGKITGVEGLEEARRTREGLIRNFARRLARRNRG